MRRTYPPNLDGSATATRGTAGTVSPENRTPFGDEEWIRLSGS